MEHLENHPHAFLDENNKVLSVLVFDEHNYDLLLDVKNILEASDVICCCDNGLAQVGWTWENNSWTPPPPRNIML